MANKNLSIPSYAPRKTQNTAEPEAREAGGQGSSHDEGYQSNQGNKHHPRVQEHLDRRAESQAFFYPVRAFGDVSQFKDGGGIPGVRTDSYLPVIGHPGVAPTPKRSGGKDRVPPVTKTELGEGE